MPCVIVISYEPPGKPSYGASDCETLNGVPPRTRLGEVSCEENAGQVDRVSHGFPMGFPTISHMKGRNRRNRRNPVALLAKENSQIGHLKMGGLEGCKASQVPALSFRSFQTSIHLQLCLLNSRPKMRLNGKVLLIPGKFNSTYPENLPYLKRKGSSSSLPSIISQGAILNLEGVTASC